MSSELAKELRTDTSSALTCALRERRHRDVVRVAASPDIGHSFERGWVIALVVDDANIPGNKEGQVDEIGSWGLKFILG